MQALADWIAHYNCSQHWLKRFSGVDVRVMREILSATSKAAALEILARPPPSKKILPTDPNGLTAAAQKKIQKIPKETWIPVFSNFATMHDSTQSGSESFMGTMNKAHGGVDAVRNANDMFQAMRRSMNLLEQKFKTLHTEHTTDLLNHPDEALVPYVRRQLAGIAAKAQLRPLSLMSETRTAEGNCKAVAKRYNSQKTVRLELDPKNTFRERGSNGKHQAEGNLHFDGSCSLHCPPEFPSKKPCECLAWYVNYIFGAGGDALERFACYADTRLNARRAFEHSGVGDGDDDWSADSGIMNVTEIDDEGGNDPLLHHGPFTVPPRGRQAKNSRYKGCYERCAPRVEHKKSKRKKPSSDEQLQESPEQIMSRLEILVDNNILLILEEEGGNYRRYKLFEDASTKVNSVLENSSALRAAMDTVNGMNALLKARCAHLVEVGKISTNVNKSHYKYQDVSGGGGGGGGGGGN